MKKVRYDMKKGRSSYSRNESGLINMFLDSVVGKLILIGISVLMLLSVYRSVKQMGQKISLLKQAEQEVQDLRLENLELSLRIEEAGSIDSLEKEARDRLNYGDEDEIAFVIDEELIQLGKDKVSDILNPQEDIEEVDVLGQWRDFIIEGY